MGAAVPNTPRVVIPLTAQAAADLGVSGSLTCGLWMAQTPVGFSFQIAQSVNGDWRVISTAINQWPSPYLTRDELLAEIKYVGTVKAFIVLKVCPWVRSVFKNIFAGRVPGPLTGGIIPAPNSENVVDVVNATLLAEFVFSDPDADGIPELVAR